jgi:hypothetical protein
LAKGVDDFFIIAVFLFFLIDRLMAIKPHEKNNGNNLFSRIVNGQGAI